MLIGTMAIAQTDKYEIQVDGLGCPFCAYGLEKKFKDFKGIKKIKIDIESGNFSFVRSAEKPLGIEEIRAKVREAGYTPNATLITRSTGEQIAYDSASSDVQITTKTTLAVAGKCGMCKSRIEDAAHQIDGVATAVWSQDDQLLTLEGGDDLNISAVVEKLLSVGHDTEGKRAADATYDALPPCCLYDRAQ